MEVSRCAWIRIMILTVYNNGYTPASLANKTSQPKEELDGNGTCF